MSSVTTKFVKQPIVTLLEKLVKGREVGVTVATAFAAAKKSVDTVSVRRGDEAAPCCRGI